MEFVNPMVEIRIIKDGNNRVGFVKELPEIIADYPSSFIPLIVEKISFIDWDVFHIQEINL